MLSGIYGSKRERERDREIERERERERNGVEEGGGKRRKLNEELRSLYCLHINRDIA
jgi:hypothetical protein